jgi:hypothetical protein
MKLMSATNVANGYTWELRGNVITCDNIIVCLLEFFEGFWRIRGEDFKFEPPLSAFYFVMDRCV